MSEPFTPAKYRALYEHQGPLHWATFIRIPFSKRRMIVLIKSDKPQGDAVAGRRWWHRHPNTARCAAVAVSQLIASLTLMGVGFYLGRVAL